MRHAVGVDIGGTAVKLGVIGEDGSILGRASVPIRDGVAFDALAAELIEAARSVVEDCGFPACAVGIGTPGFADKSTGVLVEGCRNIPTLQGRSMPAALEKGLGIPAFIDNDATSAAAGELRFGAGRSYESFVLITLGTGIGGGLVLDRRVFRGSHGFAAEIGHMCLDPNGLWCNCGSRGCFEQYASAPAIVRLHRERLAKRGLEVKKDLTAKAVFDSARGGDPVALGTVDAVARRIAQAFGTLVNLLNLDACIVGGGVSAAGEVLLDPVRRHLPDHAWPLLHRDVEVCAADLENDAGVLGAAACAFDRLQPLT